MRIGAWLGIALLSTGALHAQRSSGFPHAQHAKLFPDCAGCHAGILSGDATTAMPAPSTCAQCHNGRDVAVTTWSGATPQPTNLRFAHVEHPRDPQAKGTSAVCQSCHAENKQAGWMQVRRAAPTVCLSCHEAPEHLAESAICKTCHVPLTEARALPASAIATFPKPTSHGRADFASAHAPRTSADVERCATCHARESCARCHPNAARVPAIGALGSDSRVAQLMKGKAASYSTPVNHRSETWSADHGTIASKQAEGCANCHTQPSCQSCHRGSNAAAVIARLPMPAPGVAPGVVLRVARVDTGLTFARLPARGATHGDTILVKAHPLGFAMQHKSVAASGRVDCLGCHEQRQCATCHEGSGSKVHPAGFATQHKSTAASGRLDCLGCHEQRQCTTCHEGSGSKRYHALDFVARHAAVAYGQDQNCTSCHRTETFCRSCHEKTNITVSGARTGAVHTGQPLWLLQHGQAARQGMTGCTTCHQQRDCLRCHASTGLKVNPHGQNFDASRMSARNKIMCLTCHITDPLSK